MGEKTMKPILIALVFLAQFSAVTALSRLVPDSRNPRHFADTLGNPVFLIGDSPQNLPQKLTVAQMNTYYDDCVSKGINLVWICIDGQPGASADNTPPVDKKGNLEFSSGGTPAGWDLSLVNAAYFAQTIDSMLSLAESHGIYVNLMPMSQCYWPPANITANTPQKAYNYGVWLGNRYKNQRNLFWLFGNDNLDSSRQCPIARGIKSTGDNHLMSIHVDNPSLWGADPANDAMGESGNFFKHLPNSTMTWVTYNNLYSDMQVFNQAHFIYHEYMKPDVMPMLMSEGPYQKLAGFSWQVATNRVERSLNYRMAFGGGFGGAYTYGCDWMQSATTPWDKYLNMGARPHIKFFSDLVRGRAWWTLKPDWGWSFLTASSYANGSKIEDNNYTMAAYDTAGGTLGLVYCTIQQTVTINMAVMAGQTTARWFDPTTGIYTAIGGSPFANTGSRQFTTPSAAHSEINTDNSGETSNDWVLVLESAGAAREERRGLRGAGLSVIAGNGEAAFWMDRAGVVSFTDIKGRRVKQARCETPGMQKIILSGIPSGVYVMQVRTGSTAPFQRLITLVK
jgi:hypothetical protein